MEAVSRRSLSSRNWHEATDVLVVLADALEEDGFPTLAADARTSVEATLRNQGFNAPPGGWHWFAERLATAATEIATGEEPVVRDPDSEGRGCARDHRNPFHETLVNDGLQYAYSRLLVGSDGRGGTWREIQHAYLGPPGHPTTSVVARGYGEARWEWDALTYSTIGRARRTWGQTPGALERFLSNRARRTTRQRLP